MKSWARCLTFTTDLLGEWCSASRQHAHEHPEAQENTQIIHICAFTSWSEPFPPQNESPGCVVSLAGSFWCSYLLPDHPPSWNEAILKLTTDLVKFSWIFTKVTETSSTSLTMYEQQLKGRVYRGSESKKRLRHYQMRSISGVSGGFSHSVHNEEAGREKVLVLSSFHSV